MVIASRITINQFERYFFSVALCHHYTYYIAATAQFMEHINKIISRVSPQRLLDPPEEVPIPLATPVY